MGFPLDALQQTATYWAYSSADAYGDPSFAAPVALAPGTQTGVRWESKSVEIVRPAGDSGFSKAFVWSDSTVFTVGSYLFLGTSVATNPETVSGASQILVVEAIPNIKGLNTVYKAIL